MIRIKQPDSNHGTAQRSPVRGLGDGMTVMGQEAPYGEDENPITGNASRFLPHAILW